MGKRIVTVKVGGETHTADLDEILHINNADAERHTVAADMAWWGIIAAAAQAQVAKLTAAAASWYGDALVKCLQQDEKMAEWKAKANASAHTEYFRMQSDIASAQEQADKASTVHWAYVRQMSMLEAMLKSESGTQRGAHHIGSGPPAPPAGPDPRMGGYQANKKKQQPPPKED